MTKQADYVLGHSDFEVERLQVQAAAIAGITRRLIREAGIVPGMRVLDIGCGAGDVAFLLAEIVGTSGQVVAIDRNERAIETTQARSEAAGFPNVEAILATDDAIPGPPFDAAIGRYVLIHQQDPVAMIRRAAASVRGGGIIAFHEIANYYPNRFQALPQIDLFDAIAIATNAAFAATVPSPDVPGRIATCFQDAGLPSPALFWECVVGDSNSSIGRWLALSYRAMLPQMTNLGRVAPDIGDPETLVERVEQVLKANRAQVVSNPQICAWAHCP